MAMLSMIPVLGSLAMAIGYTVVMGWIFKYAIGTLTGSTLAPDNVEEYGNAFYHKILQQSLEFLRVLGKDSLTDRYGKAILVGAV